MSMKHWELHNSQNSMTADLHLLSSFCIEVYHLLLTPGDPKIIHSFLGS